MATIVKAAALIDGTGRETVRDVSVLIADGRFQRIVTGAGSGLPSDAEVIDVGANTLLPGLIDAHEHLGLRHERGYERGQMLDPEHEIAFRMAKSARENIEAGITSVRIAGDKNHMDVVCKKYIDEGYIPGPRVYTAGAGIRPSHGHGATATTIGDGVDGVRRAIRESVAKGSHHIKLFVTGGTGTIGTDPLISYFTREEIAAGIEEAHNVGRRTMAHIHGGPGADYAIEAGLDSVEHGAYLTEAQVEKMIKHGTWLVPTLTVSFHERPQPDHRPPEVIEKGRLARAARAEQMPWVIRSGLKIAAGCDSWHGEVAMEMELFCEFGMTPMRAIQSATRDAADLLGELHDIGTVEVGKRADLIAVEGDPLADISAARNVRLVLRDGIRFV
jgi:imidazolonepropionase-like amidohydrolase